MPDERPTTGGEEAPRGISGGPGPTPPGVEDGTPPLRPAAPESGVPIAPEEQKEAGEAAERSAGTRQAEIEEAASREDPEEPDPS